MTTTVLEEVETPTMGGYRLAQRVVFPADGDLDALPLYIDRSREKATKSVHPEDILSRTSCLVQGGERVSFGSYFNAFAASYWRRWTIVESVRLRVRTSGDGTVVVYRSNARGAQQRVTHVQVVGDETSVFELPLGTFGDGGWYWFDLIARDHPLRLVQGDWLVPDHGRPHGRVTLSVTTFNRPDYCVRTIATVAQESGLLDVLDELIIVDQGTTKVRDQDGFDEAAAQMGDQLSLVDQPNLGGSGGFSRGMYETVTRGRSDYVVLLDDDIILEPESISRLATFADLCRTPTIVGGHMFDINNRPVLHTFGEVVNPFSWQPVVPSPDHYLGHDFALKGLRATSWMHQRVEVDYNGWWMCLIPVQVIKKIGLSMPIFIKWDDTEYGLRAKEADIATVSLPGAAVWHIPWTDKDDLVGWQAYFHARNRLITALMYSPFERGKNMVYLAYFLDLKHLVSMQYYTGTGRIMALKDVLRGPEHLHEIQPTRLQEIRALAAEFTDAQVKSDVDSFPPVKRRRPVRQRSSAEKIPIPLLALLGAKAVARQVLVPVDKSARENPQQHIAHKDNRWYRVAKNDSALVSTAEGTGTSWYIRDPQKMRELGTRSTGLYSQVFAQWKALRQRYRAARDEITSFAAWEKAFGLTEAEAVQQGGPDHE